MARRCDLGKTMCRIPQQDTSRPPPPYLLTLHNMNVAVTKLYYKEVGRLNYIIVGQYVVTALYIANMA